MSYSKNGFLATGTGGGGGGGTLSAITSPIPAPVTGSTWVLNGVANYPDASTLNLTTSVASVTGNAWYPTQVTLDGLYVAFDGYFAIDALRLLMGDPATDTTATTGAGHGAQVFFESYYNATRPTPDTTIGAYATLQWLGSGGFTSAVFPHVVDSTMNLSTSGSQYGPARIEVFVKATSLANMYRYLVFKDGAPYMDSVLPGPVGGKVLLGFNGNTGGSYGINAVKNFVGYTGLTEIAAAAQYQVPTLGQINYSELTFTAAKTITNQAFSLIPFDSIVSDPNNLFNTTTSIYTVPVTGTYAVGLTFRSDAIAGSNVGLAINTSNVDSTNTVWRQDYAGTGNRHTYQYYKVAKFNAGDQLRAIAYVDVAGTTLISGATMTFEQVATSATVASAASLPETVSTASAAATYSIPDPTIATISNLTLTANSVFTFPTAGAGKSFTLTLIQDATGSRTVTWPVTVKWAGGTAPTLTTTAAKTDLLTFVCIDGTNWLGTLAGKAF